MLMIIAIIVFGLTLLSGQCDAQDAIDDKYITASLDIHNESQLLAAPEAFAGLNNSYLKTATLLGGDVYR